MTNIQTTTNVRTAVIPVAGVGSRFAPASFYVPKELLPIYDTPALQYVISEALSAGVERIILVSSRNKPAINVFAELVWCSSQIEIVYQDEPNGLGHAVGCARDVVAGEPFVVLLPDEIMGDSSLLMQLAAQHDATGSSAVGLKRVPRKEVSSYGCVTTTAAPDANGVVQVTGTLYVGDWDAHAVRRFHPDGQELPPLGSDIKEPSGIALDGDRLLVVSRGEDVVRVVPLDRADP